MNALRLAIAVLALLMSALGSGALATPSPTHADTPSCHQSAPPSDPEPSPDDNAHKAMPCCAHALSAPLPPALVWQSIVVSQNHPVMQQAELLSLPPALDPKPPRDD